MTHNIILPAATELGVTLGKHLDTRLLIQGRLLAETVEKDLLRARPVNTFYKQGEPEREAYLRIVSLLAPRLCAMAPELPDYSQVRDSALLAQMAGLVADAPNIFAELGDVQESIQTIQQQIERTDRSIRKVRRTTDRTGRAISRAAAKQEKEKGGLCCGVPQDGPRDSGLCRNPGAS